MPLSHARHAGHSLNEVARRIAPHLRIVSASRPTPVLRKHNVLAVADSPDAARSVALALESIEVDDDKLGTVVMGASSAGQARTAPPEQVRPDPEDVTRVVLPRIILGALIGAVVGAILLGGAALVLGSRGWSAAASGAGGAMMGAVFGAIWLTFAGLGGTDAYRQTFVDDAATELAIVSVHTDDADEARAVHDRLEGTDDIRILDVDRVGWVTSTPGPDP